MNRKLQRFQAWLDKWYIPFVSLLMSLCLLIIGYTSVQPKQYDFVQNQVAELTVRAPKTIEDTEKTKELKHRAKEAVPDAYLFNADIQTQQVASFEQFFTFLKQIRKQEFVLGESDNKRRGLFLAFSEEAQQDLYATELAKADTVIQEVSDTLTTETVLRLLRVSEEQFSSIQTIVAQMLTDTLAEEYAAGDMALQLAKLKTDLRKQLVLADEQAIAEALLDYFVVPTVVFNQAETQKRQAEAENAIQPSYILQGQVIVQEGHVIDSNSMRQLELFGYLDVSTQYTTTYAFYWVVAIHGIFILGLFTKGFRFKKIKLATASMQLTAYSVAFVFGFALLRLFEMMQTAGIQYATLLFPIWIVPMLIIPKTNQRIGIVAIIFFNLLGLFLLNEMSNLMEMMLPALLFFFSSVLTLLHLSNRTSQQSVQSLLKKSLIGHVSIVVPLLLSLNMDLISDTSFRVLAFIIIGQLVSHAVVYLMWPYWEQMLSDRAPMTLNQLANLNHPLLKLLIEKAPGSYHHSILVANLSANAVELIGGDSLLTRVASYYHDVGKTVYPLFFVENLPSGMESPHLMLSPKESTNIIIGHVLEGVKLLEAHDLPQSVIDICWQHHGTTLVKYFYNKAKKENPDIEEHEFRYVGPIPQSKEAAIIMLADSLEAASRTLKDYSQATIEALVDKIVTTKIEDNQFVECGLTVQELRLVKRSLVTGIASMYHTRIEYPE